tara:strand:+ start:2984 stop:3925 length:942 start_codon:yes stop_codon:yes gene_type:complete
MSVSFKHVENQKLFEARIKITELSSEEQVALVMNDYESALDAIADKMQVQDIWYFGITLSLKRGLIKIVTPGISLRAVRIMARARSTAYGSERNPWKAVCPEFWLAACQFPSLHDRICATLNKIEHMLVAAREAGSCREGLREDDTTAFAEPLVSLLALQDLRFVDAYRRLMNQWDMQYEVDQLEVIDLIVRTYKMCPETEQLLYDRATISAGQNGESQIEDLYPTLQQAYGAFTESLLFQRIINWLHAEDMKERQEAFVSYKDTASRMPIPVLRQRNTPPFHYSDNTDLKTAAKTMFAELDRQHALASFLSL